MNFRTSFRGMFVHPPFLSIGMFASRDLFPHLEMLILVTVGLTKSDGTVCCLSFNPFQKGGNENQRISDVISSSWGLGGAC